MLEKCSCFLRYLERFTSYEDILARIKGKKGFDMLAMGRIPLKTAAVKCGVGYQGKMLIDR
jgi:hypothetical protein